MSLTVPTLHATRLTLRPFESEDKDQLFELQSNARVARYWDAPPWNDRQQADTFLATCVEMAEAGKGARLVVERTSDREFLGWCVLARWNAVFRSASLGYCFTENTWGQGIATEASQALLMWAFETLPLNRVQAETDTRNIASARVLEKLGFIKEGELRQDCIVNGEISDTWVFGLLRQDWEQTT